MIKSMTACGFSKKENSVGSLTCQIQSVNRKHFDLSLQLPEGLFAKEADLRLLIAQKVQRGHLHIRIQFFPKEGIELETRLHLPMVKSLKKEIGELSSLLEMEMQPELWLSLLTSQKGFFISEIKESSSELLFTLLHEVIIEAILKMDEMKKREGEHLKEEMEKRALTVQRLFSSIESESKTLPAKITARYRDQLALLLPRLTSEDRVAEEIAFLVQEADVTEEMVRFRIHLIAFLEVLRGHQEGGGKKLEFILQELLREINTLSAKAKGVVIPPLAIEIKCELEKLREQVQNVE